ncbi:uncharacterized protein LOC124919174 [Impatiens glandulifera]|uniref:uncharacterized protein LOC124919174 n=1 Tax=Impatiens glandulifera TaxID=253017 RepID=UPI001FB175DB|nr:uncharacterized protein LOC124919174 [Impatiens glandulifera]
MPLFEIGIARPSVYSSCIFASRVQTHNKFVVGDVGKRFCSPSFPPKERDFSFRFISRKRSLVVIKAVTTVLEPVCSVQKDVLLQQLCSAAAVTAKIEQDDEPELDEREKLRRTRISKANKGNTPWNKGRKHSAETLQRIKERTKLAMQNPKVKQKLSNLGHAQSNETRAKIAIGVRMGWERRREKNKLQETCHYEWQNLVAEASRRGFIGQDEVQWDSYKILDADLQKGWLESIEQRRIASKPVGSKKAPKSAQQKKKISEAISAKWADPEYRSRVCSALAKYYSTTDGIEKKPRRKPVGEVQTRVRTPKRKTEDMKISEDKVSSQYQRPQLKSKAPLYKDPLASSKLEMIKNIRAQRTAKESKKTDAIESAKQMIVEAEKAVKALEVAAKRSPIAQASLIEARELIAEAIQSIRSLENGTTDSFGLENGTTDSLGLINDLETENNPREVNGIGKVNGNGFKDDLDIDLTNFSFHEFLNGKEKSLEELYQVEIDKNSILNGSSIGKNKSVSTQESNMMEIREKGIDLEECKTEKHELPSIERVVTKKWVCGRLVEVQLEGG